MSITKEPQLIDSWTDARQEFHARHLPHTPPSFRPFLEEDVHQTIQGRFEQIVTLHPENVAIKTPEWSLTYDALNHRANQIAHALIEQFGSEQEQVAFLLPNDGSAVAVLLGILKAGKSYVPLDPLFPQERLAYMLADSQASFVLADSENSALAADLKPGITVVNVEELGENHSDQNPAIYGDPLSLAYILFTSGSTGLPKGMGFPHRSLLHTTMCLVNSLRISPDDSMTQLHSTSFASSIVDIYCGLTTGATVYPWDVKSRGFVGLADWLREERVTSFQWIPTPFRHFMDTLEPNEQLPDIRLVVMASEPLTEKEVNLHRQHFAADCLMVNQMGTSESHNYNLYFIGHDTVVESYILPAGHSVSEDREVLILDEHHQPLPAGETGEIAIQTEYMSLGYFQKPELTAEKFLADPQGGDKGIYLTGDLGKLLPDGCLIHQGRSDFQVKIRGYRIEVNEIEKTLNECPGIRDAVVAAKDSTQGEKQLVAYIMRDKRMIEQPKVVINQSNGHVNGLGSHSGGLGQSVEMADLVDAAKSYLGERLPDYMVPSLFVELDAFPTTVTGKMDRMSLPDPGTVAETPPMEKHSYVAPRTQTEIRLVQIWSKLLGKSSISTNESFFDLGGHSLLAARLFFDIERDLGARVPLATLFHAQTVAELAKVIDGDFSPISWDSLTPIQTAGTKPPLFLIHAHGGNVLGYYELANYLGKEQPIYGLQAMGLDGKSIVDRSFDEIAAAYLAEIRTLQPTGPYYLSGYCFGGSMAFAMAQQLHSAGEEVAFLALIESGHQNYPLFPKSASSLERHRSKLINRLAFEWESATTDGLQSVWPHIRARITRAKDIFQIKAESTLDDLGKKLGVPIPQSQLYIQERLEQVHDQAFHGYSPKPYNGDMLLFRAEHQPPGIIRDDTMGWGETVLGELTIYEQPGFPVGLLDEPRVKELAHIIGRHLSEAQAAHS